MQRFAKATLATLTLGLASLLGACSSLFESPDSDRFLYLDTRDTLQVRFHYSAPPEIQMGSSSLADALEDQRYSDFQQVAPYLLETANLPMDYRILGPREDPEKGHPVLDLHAIIWELESFGEVRAVLRARLTSYGERNTLGTFTAEEHPPATMSSEAVDRTFQRTMGEAIRKMLPTLLTHFELPEGQPSVLGSPNEDSAFE